MCHIREGCNISNRSFHNYAPRRSMDTEASNTGKIGRPRGFDEEAALEAAMRVFWAKSYEGATMSDLTEAMGINRSSMYAAFGAQQTLFQSAIERYRARPMTYVREALALPTLREVVPALLYGTVEFLGSSETP